MSDDERPRPDPLAPYPTLAEREAGTLPQPELYEDIPHHLEIHLRSWVNRALGGQDDLARRVATRCRMYWRERVEVQKGVFRPLTSREALYRVFSGLKGVQSERPVDKLTVVDAIISLHPDWEPDPMAGWGNGDSQQDWLRLLMELNTLLKDSGSAWYVDGELRGLYRRVDPTATEAWRLARQTAEEAGRTRAAQYLGQAWQELYGQRPDASAGYAAAVKAVEAAVLPVVFPDRKQIGKRRTVHQARTELVRDGGRWRFVLGETDAVSPGEGAVDVVAGMLDRLLRGETERHADDDNRPSQKEEAEAAIHLAVLLVQWFATGAIRPRESPV